MRKFISRSILLAALMMSLNASNIVYGAEITKDKTEQSSEAGEKEKELGEKTSSLYVDGDKVKWVEMPGGYIGYDYMGNVMTGYFFDDFGDYYYAGENGYIKTGTKDIWNQEYGSDGRLANPGYNWNVDLYREKSIQLEAGYNVEFESLSDLYNFTEYYGKEYNLGKQTLSFKYYKKTVLNNKDKKISTKFFTNNSLNEYYNREEVITALNNKFNTPLIGNTILEKVKDACDKVKVINYSEENKSSSTLDMIGTNTGGCWHFAKVVHHLLGREGIYSEIVTGRSYGESHMWLRIRDENNKWVYCDPTYYASGLEEYLNIDYKIYCDNYRTYRFFN